MVFVLVLLALPIGIGVALAVSVGGWTSVLVALIGYGALIVLLSLVVRAAVRSWRPVRSLIGAAGRLADGDYTARARSSGPSTFTPVTSSFNRMAERLEAAEEERRRLLADIGHELRTPLTLIRGEVEAMIDGVHPTDPDRLQSVLRDVAVMEHLLDDLRTLSTAEAGMLRIHREPTDMVRLVTDTLDRFGHDAEAAGVDLVVDVAHSPVEAEVDPVRLGEVVANLVRNAIRATPAGGSVTVAVTDPDGGGSESENESGSVTIEVVDTGRGIPADELDRVFDRFHKGPESDGTGLGLTISRDLVAAHGGELTLRSEPARGTTASVTLPVAVP